MHRDTWTASQQDLAAQWEKRAVTVEGFLLHVVKEGKEACNCGSTQFVGKARGNIDGVNVYSRRQGTSEWKFLGRDTQSPYVDTTPLATAGTPEVREYRVRSVIDDAEIGDHSPTRQITVT